MGKGQGLHPNSAGGYPVPQPQEWRGQGALPTVPETVMSPSLGSGGKEDLGLHRGSAGPWVHTISEPGEEAWGTLWGCKGWWGPELQLGEREGPCSCAWGAPGEALLQEASSFPKFLQLPQPLSGYPSSGHSWHRWAASAQQASGTTWAVVERVWTT